MKKIIAAAVVALAGSTANAATLDFSGLPPFASGPVTVAGATLTPETGGGIFQFGRICFSANGSNCEGDGTIAFTSDISDLRFDISGQNEGDFLTVTALLDGADVGSVDITDNGSINAFAGLTLDTLVFDDSSTGRGFGYTNFQFNVAAVPLPAGVFLMLGGLGLLGAVRRKSA